MMLLPGSENKFDDIFSCFDMHSSRVWQTDGRRSRL